MFISLNYVYSEWKCSLFYVLTENPIKFITKCKRLQILNSKFFLQYFNGKRNFKNIHISSMYETQVGKYFYEISKNSQYIHLRTKTI